MLSFIVPLLNSFSFPIVNFIFSILHTIVSTPFLLLTTGFFVLSFVVNFFYLLFRS